MMEVKIVRNQKNLKVEPSSVFQKDFQTLLLSLLHPAGSESHSTALLLCFPLSIGHSGEALWAHSALKRVRLSLPVSGPMAEAQGVRGSCLLGSPEQYDNVVFLL